MTKTKIAVTLDAALLRRLDRAARERHGGNRSVAVADAVRTWLSASNRRTYLEALALVDPEEERAFAEEGVGGSGPWPEPY